MREKRDEINIEAYSNLVRSIVARYRNYGCPEDDLFQEGMIGLLAFATYAAYRVKKKIIEALNRERRGSMVAIPYNDEIFQQVPDADISPDDRDSPEEGETLQIPEGIPTLEREFLVLHFEKKLTLKEISTRLDMSRERVRQLKQKALRRLKLTGY